MFWVRLFHVLMLCWHHSAPIHLADVVPQPLPHNCCSAAMMSVRLCDWVDNSSEPRILSYIQTLLLAILLAVLFTMSSATTRLQLKQSTIQSQQKNENKSRSAGLRLCPSYSYYGCAGLCNDAEEEATIMSIPVGNPSTFPEAKTSSIIRTVMLFGPPRTRCR